MSIYFVFLLSLLNGTSARAANVLLVLYALELGAQPITVGILGATFSVFPMLVSFQAGKFADRFGSLWLFVFGAIVGALGLLVPYFAPGFFAIFLAAALTGLSSTTYNVSLQNLVGLLSNPRNRAQDFSNYSLIASATNFLGPLIAGFSIDQSSHAAACIYIALLTLAPVAMLAIWGHVLPRGARHATQAGSGIRAMLSEPGVRRVLATSSLLNSGRELYQFYLPVYAHAVGLSASPIGMVLAVNSAAEFVVRLILPRLIARFNEEKLLTYSFYVGAASLMFIPFFQGAVILALISFIFGLGMGCCGPIVTMLMFIRSPDGRSGASLGLKITVSHFTKLVSPVVFGSIGSALGLFPMFWINALMLASGGILSRSRPSDRAAPRR